MLHTLLLALVFTGLANAREIKALKITNGNKGAFFAPEADLEEGSFIYVYAKKANKKLSATAILKVIRCDLEECEAKLIKGKKGAQLFTNNYYSTTDLKPKKSGRVGKKNQAFITYGGPLTKGYNFGYFRQYNPKWRLGFKGGLIDATIGKVGIEGRYFSLQTEYLWTKLGPVDLNPYFELGYMQTTLDFANINGPEFDDSVPYLGLGLNASKTWNSFFIILKGGMTYNMLKEIYSDATADYSLPFSGGLIVFELGAGLVF